MNETTTYSQVLSDSPPRLYFLEAESKASVGGKTRNLFFLKKKGFRVPRFVVIPAEVLTSLLLNESLRDENISEIRDNIFSLTIDDEFIKKILRLFPGVQHFSVRSSAIDEDGKTFSFAGQYDSFLYVKPENLAAKIKEVWLSAFGERVIAYRKENALPLHSSLAVIIQEMIDSDASGVAFGANPANNDREEKVISAVFGVGEGLVSGELDADTYYVKAGKIRKVIARKEMQRVFDKTNNEGSILQAVGGDKILSQSLTDKQILEIEIVLSRLYKEYGTYQDIEFAIKDGELFLLQARPITTLSKQDNNYIVWDNSNIIESYPGVTSPLTFSFILPVYEGVYRQFAAMMGISKEDIEENKEVFANMLGLLRGRVYYNLLSWYKVLALLPGYSLNAGFMEQMMGVKERFELRDLKKRTKFKERMRVAKMIAIMLGNLRKLSKMRKHFVGDFNEVMKRFSAIDFSASNAWELMNYYQEFEQTLLKKWKAPLVNDFFAMIYYGILQKLVVKYKIPGAASIHNDLLCGAKDIISTEPIKRILIIVKEIDKHRDLHLIVSHHNEKEIYDVICSGDYPDIKFLVDDYLQTFGERCVGELKLETITYKQDPLSFIRIIKSYVQQGMNEMSHKNMEGTIRIEAEKTISAALSGSFIKRKIFSYVLRNSRELISGRENLRFERTRAFGIVRNIFYAIGENFYKEKILRYPKDIFFLTKEEIFDYIKGTSVNIYLQALIDLRKKEYEQFAGEDLGERIRTNGIAYSGNTFIQTKFDLGVDGQLHGIPCCAGIVRGRVRVISDPKEILNLGGDILVASSTDPGWITLFPTASAILVERGSLLSHSAIVSREMGKPCIVGITGLLEILKTGDEIEMNGGTGEIKILSQATS